MLQSYSLYDFPSRLNRNNDLNVSWKGPRSVAVCLLAGCLEHSRTCSALHDACMLQTPVVSDRCKGMKEPSATPRARRSNTHSYRTDDYESSTRHVLQKVSDGPLLLFPPKLIIGPSMGDRSFLAIPLPKSKA